MNLLRYTLTFDAPTNMTCAVCKYEFCWVCSGPWKDHSGSYYACNRYDPEKEKESTDGKKKDTSRAALERYLHYYTRYTNHDQSLKMETEAKMKMEAKVKLTLTLTLTLTLSRSRSRTLTRTEPEP